MYEEKTTAITDNQSTGSGSTKWVLKDVYAWRNKKMQGLVAGEDITVSVVEGASLNSDVLVTGRALFDAAKKAVANIKKACAFLRKRQTSAGGLASGLTPDDVLDGVLDDLFEENILQPRRKRQGVIKVAPARAPEDKGHDSSNEDPNDNPDDIDVTTKQEGEEKRPDDWIPHGWFAFLLFGPLAPSSSQLNLLCMDENPVKTAAQKKKLGRDAQRKKAAQEKEDERKSDTKSTRGLNIDQRMNLRSLEQKERVLEQTDREHALYALTEQQKAVTRQLEVFSRISGDFAEAQMMKCVAELTDLKERINAIYSLASEEASKQKKKRSLEETSEDQTCSSITKTADSRIGIELRTGEPTRKKATGGNSILDIESVGSPPKSVSSIESNNTSQA